MATTKYNDDRLKKLEQEVGQLRREFELFIPHESLEEYDNATEIKEAHRRAIKEHVPHRYGDY